LVYAPHWYDGLTLFGKSFRFYNVNLIGMMRGTVSGMDILHLGDQSIARGCDMRDDSRCRAM